MPPIIRVENLGKRYQLGASARRRPTLREALVDAARAPWERLRRLAGRADETESFWALDDVSFEVQPGEAVGIIGRNGAGKSTLLKILSRITEPTRGRIELRGRVASLLEVGTGFHSELTGRENIYLNGAILGMSRAEIRRKFDEIVAFAEVERFLDTQVKHYSSGMYMRLAFAVAAHLDPEILVVDEVLAVGDAEFQKKCLGKMNDVARHGRTVLFVSHNMGAVSQLCSRAILLERGAVRCNDRVEVTIERYMAAGSELRGGYVDLESSGTHEGSGEVKFTSASLLDANGNPCCAYSIGDELSLTFTLRPVRPVAAVKLAVRLWTRDGLALANMVDCDSGFALEWKNREERIVVRLDDLRLYPGAYVIGIWAGSTTSTETFDAVEQCLEFEIAGGGQLTTRRLPRSAGILFLTPKWTVASNPKPSGYVTQAVESPTIAAAAMQARLR